MSTKVFVGNLAFRTTDQALTEAFSKHGEVKSGVIITRGRRSLGYGFVEFATTEQAATAVDKMKGAEIAGREIKVELAKDITDPEGDYQGERTEGDGPAKRRRRAPQDKEAGANNTSSGNNRGNSSSSGNTGGNNDHDSDKRRGKPRARKGRPEGDRDHDRDHPSGANTSSSNTNSAERPARAPRPPREPREPREKIPSKTTVFVANLPFSVTDAELLSVFAGTKAKAAHVALTRNGRSRGYGFVEFENEADQLEALKTHQGKAIEGTNGQRNLSLTISHSVPNPAPAPGSAAAPATN